LTGTLRDIAPISLEQVTTRDQRLLWRELVGRYHYLGHTVPYGAQLRYLVWASEPERAVVSCVQLSSPAWRMACGTGGGVDDRVRARGLQRVVCNSRFLILPWVQVRNLASAALAAVARRVVEDWPRRYGVEPYLLETTVDRGRFTGTCYRAPAGSSSAAQPAAGDGPRAPARGADAEDSLRLPAGPGRGQEAPGGVGRGGRIGPTRGGTDRGRGFAYSDLKRTSARRRRRA